MSGGATRPAQALTPEDCPRHLAPSVELLVATWNVHGCVGADRRRDAARVARVLRELGAGLVGLQEVDSRPGPTSDSAQMEFLASTAGYHAVPGHTIETTDRLYGNVLLTRWPVLRVRHIDLSEPRREPRGCIDATVEICGHALRVLVTHFGLRRRERRRQITRLLRALDGDLGGPTLLLGDLNEWWPFGPVRRGLLAGFGTSRVLRTFPARHPLLALDRIYAQAPARLAATWAERGGDASRASDHLPVLARLELG